MLSRQIKPGYRLRLPPPYAPYRLTSPIRLSTHGAFPPSHDPAKEDVPRRRGSFFISNVFPIRLSRWDIRPLLSTLREDDILERLEAIAEAVTVHDWKLEDLEVSRKDGGVFLNYSFVPPAELVTTTTTTGDASGTTIPIPFSAARTFLPLLSSAAHERGGFPNWLGQWYASTFLPGPPKIASSAVEEIEKQGTEDEEAVEQEEEAAAAAAGQDQTCGARSGGGGGGAGTDILGRVEKGVKLFALGDGRCWAVRGKQWTEDLDRYSSSRLRVEFDGPDVSQEVLYELFRPYGRVSNIIPPSPVPSGNLRFAEIVYTRLTPSTIAINVLHGLSTPTNTRDFTLIKDARLSGAAAAAASGSSPDPPPEIPRTRLRLYYERPLKAHAIRDWLANHPKLTIPTLAFLIGTLSYTFFDPIRRFFVEAHIQGFFELEGYPVVKWIKSKIPHGFKFDDDDDDQGQDDKDTDNDNGTMLPNRGFDDDDEDMINEMDASSGTWHDRIAAEKQLKSWLTENPSTFITVTGPSGSGKAGLVSRVIQAKGKQALFVDCAKVAKGKSDADVVSELATQTGYWPVFTWTNNLSGLIDLAAVGLIGQKAGFATPLDQQIKQVLEVVASALKQTSDSNRAKQKDSAIHARHAEEMIKHDEEKRAQIRMGIWHDGRLDCLAGNGVMSELGIGEEEFGLNDVSGESLENVAPYDTMVQSVKEAQVLPTDSNAEKDSTTTMTLDDTTNPSGTTPDVKIDQPDMSRVAQKQATQLEAERSLTESLPVLVLDNFTQRLNTKSEAWDVVAEWAAALVENKIAHVIVITDSTSAMKPLTRALPAKPFNSIVLSDADKESSMNYVVANLGASGARLTSEEKSQVEKIGGRMIDLELLVYKVRSGLPVREAVDDIITRSVVELRKSAFGDDTEDAKSLPWTRAQAWKIVSELAKHGAISYPALLQDFPFKGNESALRALEDKDLIAVSFIDGRASRVRPGKPLYQHVFKRLTEDPVFVASTQIEYNNALIAAADATIQSVEAELLRLKEIGESSTGSGKMSPSSWFGGKSATDERVAYLMAKMNKAVQGVKKLEEQNEECKATLATNQ